MSGTRVWQYGNGTLLIEEVWSQDEGLYWCIVWNNKSVAMEMTRLIITEESHPPPATASASLHHLYFSVVLLSLIMWTVSL